MRLSPFWRHRSVSETTDGGRRSPLVRTPREEAFLRQLLKSRSLDVWLHEDEAGRWLLVSKDVVEGGTIRATLRLDYDGSRIEGGWSPACLNWDDGVRARDAGVDIQGPDGIEADGPPELLAELAARWFDDSAPRPQRPAGPRPRPPGRRA